MNRTSDGEQTFPPVRAVIGELDSEKQADGSILPFRHCKLVVSNGGIWSIRCLAYIATEQEIFRLWNTKPELFTKVDPNAPPASPVPIAEKSEIEPEKIFKRFKKTY